MKKLPRIYEEGANRWLGQAIREEEAVWALIHATLDDTEGDIGRS